MATRILMADVPGFVKNALLNIRKGIEDANSAGLQAELPLEAQFSFEIVSSPQSLVQVTETGRTMTGNESGSESRSGSESKSMSGSESGSESRSGSESKSMSGSESGSESRSDSESNSNSESETIGRSANTSTADSEKGIDETEYTYQSFEGA